MSKISLDKSVWALVQINNLKILKKLFLFLKNQLVIEN